MKYRKKTSCGACSHKHAEGDYCHVFVMNNDNRMSSWSEEEEGAAQGEGAEEGINLSRSEEQMEESEPQPYEDWVEDDDVIPGKSGKTNLTWTPEQVISEVKSLVNRLTGSGQKKEEKDVADATITVSAAGFVLSNTNSSEPPLPEEKQDEAYSSTTSDEDNDDSDDTAAAAEREEEAYQEQSFLNDQDSQARLDPRSDLATGEGEGGPEDSVSLLGQSVDADPTLQGNELNEPAFLSSVGMRRCKCRQGVPKGDRDYIPVPENRYVGGLLINVGDCAEAAAMAPQCPPPPGIHLPMLGRFDILSKAHPLLLILFTHIHSQSIYLTSSLIWEQETWGRQQW